MNIMSNYIGISMKNNAVVLVNIQPNLKAKIYLRMKHGTLSTVVMWCRVNLV